MRRFMAIVLLAGGVTLLVAYPAGAHALVRSSDPANGAILQQAPTQVVITFTETPDPKLSVIHVLDSSGRSVEGGSAVPFPGQPLELRVPLSSLPQGVYTVTWRTVSRVDGHVTAGSFSFGVGVSPAGAASPKGTTIAATPSPSALAVAGRWAFYWGLALLMGGAVVGAFVLGELPRGGRALLGGSWILAAAGLVMMTVAERSTVGVPLGQLLRSGAGREFINRAVALGIVGLAVAAALIRPRRTTLPFVGLATAIAMVVHVRAGHPGAISNAPARWFDIGVQSLHLIAVGVWVGGLAWLLLATGVLQGAERVGVVRRFSWLAGIALGAVAVTGATRAVSELGGIHAVRGLLHTSFGLTLIVKVALFGGLVALGAFNRYVNVPGITEGTRPIGRLRRTVAAEVLVAAGIFGATGVLSGLPPASTIAAAAARPAAAQQIVVTGNDFATTVRVRLTVTPGTVGPNRFEARITDYDTGRPVQATHVSLQFALPGRPDLGTPTLPLAPGSGGLWAGQGTVLSMDGRWNVSVVIQEAARGVNVPLVLQTRLPPEQITVSRAPGQPDLYTISLAGGRSLQAYVDPGKAGKNVVHFTFFQSSGSEQPIASATATALAPSGTTENLSLIRFDSGHFAANTDLVPGSWRFQIQATMPGGQVLSPYFTQQITP
jgi:copper transport protein